MGDPWVVTLGKKSAQRGDDQGTFKGQNEVWYKGTIGISENY